MLTSAELVWLMAAVAKGDQAAFERLYAATRAKLYGVALRILRRSDLADEVIQEAYLKIWNNAGSFDPKLATPITWMVAIARNRALDLIRKKGEASIEDEPAAMEAAADEPDPLARREMTEDLNACSPASASSRKTAAAWCCSPIIAGRAASSSPRNSMRRRTRSRPGCAAA